MSYIEFCMFSIAFDRVEKTNCGETKPKDAVSPEIAAAQRIFTLKLFSSLNENSRKPAKTQRSALE